MTSLVRVILTWLLVLALPVQGYAASSLRWCGMAQQQGSTTAAPHDHAAMLAAAMPEHAGQGTDAAAKGTQGGTDGSTDAGKCSVCAACCGAPALASMGPVVAVVPATPPYGAVLMVALTGTSPEGFERPPRATGH